MLGLGLTKLNQADGLKRGEKPGDRAHSGEVAVGPRDEPALGVGE